MGIETGSALAAGGTDGGVLSVADAARGEGAATTIPAKDAIATMDARKERRMVMEGGRRERRERRLDQGKK